MGIVIFRYIGNCSSKDIKSWSNSFIILSLFIIEVFLTDDSKLREIRKKSILDLDVVPATELNTS
jgi:hypothetical protein